MSVIYMLLYTNPDILRRMQCKEHLQSFLPALEGIEDNEFFITDLLCRAQDL